MPTKLNPQVFTRAAELIELGHQTYGCRAMTVVLRDQLGDYIYTGSPEVRPYKDLLFAVFRRDFIADGDDGSVIWNLGLFDHEPQRDTARIVGLHLCAHLIKSGLTINDFQHPL